jgi:uncharacterized protein YecT (DUF1311 family)
MRPIICIAFAFAVSFPHPVIAASSDLIQSERAVREECSAFSQAGMRACVKIKAGESRVALRLAEDDLLRAISKWDEDSKYVRLAKIKLAMSNERFAAYREAECGFSGSLSGGGAGDTHEIRRLACVAELNSQRANQLSRSVADMVTN